MTSAEIYCPVHQQKRCKITIVCGSPGSGKTTYVKQNMRRGDLVVDLDEIARALTLSDSRDKAGAILPFACAARDAIYQRLCGEHDIERAWIITCLPNGGERRHLVYRLNAAEVILLLTSKDECKRRTAERSPELDWTEIIDKWHRDYTPRIEDQVIR